MSNEPYPVFLVHGWNSHPGIWNRLVPLLSDASIPFWKFDHTNMGNADLATRAAAMESYIRNKRDETGYTGPIDIVCHSVGTA
jgi:triacylglycerol lipase